MEHQTTLWRGEEEIPVTVHYTKEYNEGAAGSISNAPGTYVDIGDVLYKGAPLSISQQEHNELQLEILTHA